MQLAFLVISGVEWIWVILGVGLLFGASRVPQLMRSMGQGIKEFKTAVKDEERPAETSTPATAPPAPETPE
jgi:sec-independent protein translocase protein TatA